MILVVKMMIVTMMFSRSPQARHMQSMLYLEDSLSLTEP